MRCFRYPQAFEHFDIFIFSPIPSTVNCIAYVYLYNYFGEETNDKFAKVSHLLYGADWITLPIHLKKVMLIMMINAQKPLFYRTFGGFPLNLDTFAIVRRFRSIIFQLLLSLSYFVLVRQNMLQISHGLQKLCSTIRRC